MPAVIIAAAIAAAAALISAAIAAGETAKAQSLRLAAAQKFGDQKLPVLDRLVAQKLPPESLAAWKKITQAQQTQGDVLGKMMDVVNEKGETADDRAAYLRMQNAAGGIANNTNSAVERNMAQRGMSNSGMSFALQQAGAQSAVNRANQMGIQEASDARHRYSEALAQAGGLSTNIRGQEQNSMKAQDEINMFNARQQSDADRYNASLPQQQFDNEMSVRTAEANANNGVAAGYERSAGAAQQTGAGIGAAALTAGAAYDQYGNPVKKKDDYSGSAGAE